MCYFSAFPFGEAFYWIKILMETDPTFHTCPQRSWIAGNRTKGLNPGGQGVGLLVSMNWPGENIPLFIAIRQFAAS
jgi:hypothetical protein